MTPSIATIPGRLDITLKRASDFSVSLDFDTSAVGVTVTSEITSAVTGLAVSAFSTSVLDAESGSIRISMLPSQSAAIPAGTYRWRHSWDYPGDSHKTMLEGFVEVLP